MPSRKEMLLVVYPEYFDSRLSRKAGRRIPKDSAREGPTLEDLERAARAAGLEPRTEPKSAFPSRWWEHRGRLVVKKKTTKERTLRLIAKKL
jgi:signal recognition particle subunit SRP19